MFFPSFDFGRGNRNVGRLAATFRDCINLALQGGDLLLEVQDALELAGR